MKRQLIINPGSTSTKIAVYDDENPVMSKTLHHDTAELAAYRSIIEQKGFRKAIIEDALKEESIDIGSLDAVVGRGGLLRPVVSGTYEINDRMVRDLENAIAGEHASNLGAIIAREIAEPLGISSYIVDPVVVDEMDDIARISGVSEIERTSIFHALNQKAVAKRYAEEMGKNYEELRLIVAHMGGGVSIGAHKKGRVIDVNNAFNGDGPFTPERAGSVPAGKLIEMCFDGGFTKEEMLKKMTGKGGFVSYMETNDIIKIVQLANEGEKEALLMLHAFCYQVAKSIGECAVVLAGKVDAIILTGGIANDENITDGIKSRVEWICPVVCYPGEDEMLALAQGGLRVLSGKEAAKVYIDPN